jgi:hypothetical protein
LRHPATIIAAVALLVAFGGGAAAYASGLIPGSQIKNHSIAEKKLTRKAITALRGQRGRRGPRGATGLTGPTGPAGPVGATGTTGAAGSPGVVQVGGFAGPIGGIPPIPLCCGVAWAGPVTTLTTTDTQSIVASGSAGLGTSGPTLTADVGICWAPLGDYPQPLDSLIEVTVTSTLLSYAASATRALGKGTWNVGMCVGNPNATAIDNTSSSVGYAFVVNGTPVSENRRR